MKYILSVPWELRDTDRKARLLEPYAFDHALFTGEPQPSRLDPEIWIRLGEDPTPPVSAKMLSTLDEVA